MDDVTWAALTLTLTALFGVGSWLLYQRRGLAAGLKGAALTLLPAAAYLTDTLRMFTRIGTAVGDWATGLVFSPTVWIGVTLTGLAAVLYAVGRAVGSRRPHQQVAPPRGTAPPAVAPGAKRGRQAKKAQPDDDLDEIEALLRKRGIT